MENDENKCWFVGMSSRMWIPVSWEGWLLTAICVGLIFLITNINDVSNSSINLSRDWPLFLELIVVIIGFYWIS
ncbi:hypothetical protein, partial [Desulfamplus magnetovallimortis]|uniref:hypothetical protein n=1 Tax=Desulfamplus magnetovallimortis TaxID=1246637 RepID=UPI00164951E9